MALENKSFEFVRIFGTRSSIEEIPEEEILSYYIKETKNNECELVAITSSIGRNKGITLDLQIYPLLVDIPNEDIVLVNLDNMTNEFNIGKTVADYKFLFSCNSYLFLAVGENKVANIPLHRRHGHFVQLIPDETLLSKNDSAIFDTSLAVTRWPSKNKKLNSSNLLRSPTIDAKSTVVNPHNILNNIRRYSGADDLDSGGKIRSRHCLHHDNYRPIQSLKQDLNR